MVKAGPSGVQRITPSAARKVARAQSRAALIRIGHGIRNRIGDGIHDPRIARTRARAAGSAAPRFPTLLAARVVVVVVAAPVGATLE
jgi:hypothetical protein